MVDDSVASTIPQPPTRSRSAGCWHPAVAGPSRSRRSMRSGSTPESLWKEVGQLLLDAGGRTRA